MSRDIQAVLRSTSLFGGLSASELRLLAGSAVPASFSHGEVVYCEGAPAAASWLVLSGQVRIVVDLPEGRQLEVERRGPGENFGLLCRLGSGSAVYPCTALAEGRLEALRIPDPAFQEVFRGNPAVAREACSLCAERLAAMRTLAAGGRETARTRVARALMSRPREGGKAIAATRKSLAQQAGTTVETVFRSLAFFRSKGWVRTGRGLVTILNPEELGKFLGRGP